LVTEPSLVVGALQLTLVVFNFAPALQKVVVEENLADGNWRELRTRFTIEFTSEGATPEAKIKRALSVPVEPRGDREIILRIGVRGLGQVKIGRVELTDGITAQRPLKWPGGRYATIGKVAPRRGLPVPQWDANVGAVTCTFRPTDPKRKAHLVKGAP
jgi:hypothetical protein